MSNFTELVEKWQEIISSDKNCILSNHDTFYHIEIYANNKIPTCLNNLVKNDIILGAFSPNRTNVRLQIGGQEVLNRQTDINKFFYFFDDINFLYPKSLKYHDINMFTDGKIFLICAKLEQPFPYEFKYRVNNNIRYEVSNDMFNIIDNSCSN